MHAMGAARRCAALSHAHALKVVERPVERLHLLAVLPLFVRGARVCSALAPPPGAAARGRAAGGGPVLLLSQGWGPKGGAVGGRVVRAGAAQAAGQQAEGSRHKPAAGLTQRQERQHWHCATRVHGRHRFTAVRARAQHSLKLAASQWLGGGCAAMVDGNGSPASSGRQPEEDSSEEEHEDQQPSSSSSGTETSGSSSSGSKKKKVGGCARAHARMRARPPSARLRACPRSARRRACTLISTCPAPWPPQKKKNKKKKGGGGPDGGGEPTASAPPPSQQQPSKAERAAAEKRCAWHAPHWLGRALACHARPRAPRTLPPSPPAAPPALPGSWMPSRPPVMTRGWTCRGACCRTRS